MTLTAGTRLGPYEILGPLGSGGMGEVYRASDQRLRREVALKVLPDAVARDPESLARLEREARAVAALSHPNIVVIHSIESDGDHRFITMELVEGQTLDRHIASGGLPVARLLEVAIPLADALAAAHAKGVVHRDLKPSNVIVTDDGHVKVLDFGLAKIVRSDSDSDEGRTRSVDAPISMQGQVVGTVPYMAPEQLRGDPVDARTDLFALGVILYELASGTRPFVGATHATVSSAILRDSPKSLTSSRPDLPAELERVIVHCLEKAPRDRFQAAAELRDELRDLRRSLRIQSEGPSKGGETPSIAVLPFANMSADPENEFFSDGLSEELLNVLAKIPDLKVTGRTSSFAFKGKQEDLRQIGQKLGVGTLLEGSVRKAGNRVRITAQLVKVSDGFHLWSETYDRVLDDIFAVQDDIARSVSTALHVTLLGRPAATSRANAESYELILRGNHFLSQNTQAAIEMAISLYRKALEKNTDDASAWAGLARAYAFQAGFGYGNTAECSKLAKDAALRAIVLDDHSADAHEAMGLILGYLEYRWKEGMEEVQRARALAPGASGPMIAVSQFLGFSGRIDEAVRLARKAQEVDPLNPAAHANRARIERWDSNLDACRDAHLRALELSPGMTAQHAALGLVYVRQGLRDEALAEIKKELASGYRERALAAVYYALGMRHESDAALARLLTNGEAWACQFASAHAARGEVDEAFRWLERAYELHDAGIVTSKMDPDYRNLRSDPRWSKFLEKIGLAD